jgi:hypothetical protein
MANSIDVPVFRKEYLSRGRLSTAVRYLGVDIEGALRLSALKSDLSRSSSSAERPLPATAFLYPPSRLWGWNAD